MKKLGIAAVLIGVLLSACGWHGTGVVSQKDHHAGWFYTTCTPVGKTTMCHPVYVPESWEIDVRDNEGKTHTVSVDAAEYHTINIGDEFNNGGNE